LTVTGEVARNLFVERVREVLGSMPAVWEEEGRIHIGRRDSTGFFSTSQLHVSIARNPGYSGEDVLWHEEALDHKSGAEGREWKALEIALREGWRKLEDTGCMK